MSDLVRYHSCHPTNCILEIPNFESYIQSYFVYLLFLFTPRFELITRISEIVTRNLKLVFYFSTYIFWLKYPILSDPYWTVWCSVSQSQRNFYCYMLCYFFWKRTHNVTGNSISVASIWRLLWWTLIDLSRINNYSNIDCLS